MSFQFTCLLMNPISLFLSLISWRSFVTFWERGLDHRGLWCVWHLWWLQLVWLMLLEVLCGDSSNDLRDNHIILLCLKCWILEILQTSRCIGFELHNMQKKHVLMRLGKSHTICFQMGRIFHMNWLCLDLHPLHLYYQSHQLRRHIHLMQLSNEHNVCNSCSFVFDFYLQKYHWLHNMNWLHHQLKSNILLLKISLHLTLRQLTCISKSRYSLNCFQIYLLSRPTLRYCKINRFLNLQMHVSLRCLVKEDHDFKVCSLACESCLHLPCI